ncbi:flavodoxin [Limosilactobacillus fermentum]|uniref:flavodoxin n=1 Tax=Limosilactobacillus fermentum TaxID=1613 RepID=UPI000C1E2ACF|nr:flavodoxin [Limosilactobacillus fermentum]PJF07448.1 flavodoxin [Limosilactobacillus fermentum]
MNKRVVAFIVGVVAVLAVIVLGNLARSGATPSTNSSNQATSSTKKVATGKSLIVYFSRTKGVYGGDVKVGHTAQVAQDIQKYTGADMYEIVPKVDYSSNYEQVTKQAQTEIDENARPAIKTPLPDVSKYDTIYIGSPIWWGQYPMIMFTFFDKENLNGKTIIPFTTHAGSGLANTVETLKQTYLKATVLEGLAVRGTDSSKAAPKVNAWLARLGVQRAK